MPEQVGTLRRVAYWIGWGALAAVGYGVALPLMLGGAAMVPIAVVAYEEGLLEAAIATAAGLLGVAVLDQALSLPAALVFAAGAILGLQLRRGEAVGRIALVSTVLVLLALGGFFLLPAALGGNQLQMTPQDAKLFAQAFGLPGGGLQAIEAQIFGMLPAVVPLYGGLVVLEGFYFSRWALASRRRELGPVKPFHLWEAPVWLPPLYLLLLAVQLGLSLLNAAVAPQRWASFGVIWAQIPLAIIGLAVLNFWLLRMRVPGILRVITLVLLLLTPVFSQILVWVGILDGLVDLRHIHHPNST